jgi:TolB protein
VGLPESVSRDGTTIAYHVVGIYVLRADGTGLRHVVRDPNAIRPTLSPHGAQLAYVIDRGDDPWHIAVVDLESGSKTQLTSGGTDSDDIDEDVDWSPNGKALVFVRHREGRDSIVARPVEGRERTIVRALDYDLSSPIWSPDGQWIAYTYQSERVYVVRADGRDRHRLASNDQLVGSFAWSPDGETLAATIAPFVTEIDLFKAHDGRGQRRLRLRASWDDMRTLTWSPGGDLLAFSTDRGVWVVGPDGRGLRRVVAGRQLLFGWTPLAPKSDRR